MAKLPDQVTNEMAKREHRMSHYLFHGLRNSWLSLDTELQQEIRNIHSDWVPPRPAAYSNGSGIRDNNSGEDFLFMHREMIKLVNDILSTVNDSSYPKINGWQELPEPGDAEFPVVPIEGLEEIKSDNYFNNRMKPWEDQYKSLEYLRSVTLGQLGSDLEFTIHNNMHMRWATPSTGGYRPRTPITQAVDARWDNPHYDYLGDTYSSHVHPTFWKIHGWIDDRIEDWKRVNNVNNITWIGTWVGPMHHDHSQHHFMTAAKIFNGIDRDDHIDKMIKAAKVLSNVGFDGFIKSEKKQPLAEP